MKLLMWFLECLLRCVLILLVVFIAWGLQMTTAEKLSFVYGNGFGATLALFVTYCVPLAVGLNIIFKRAHLWFSRHK